MVAEVRIVGAEQFAKLGRDLRRAGLEGRRLRRELLASMRTAEAPLKKAARDSARENLPKKGGLNEWVAAGSITARNSLSGRGAGVRIVAKKSGGRKGMHDLQAIDAGEFRHPVYGTKAWVSQSINPGWFSKPLEDSAPDLKARLSLAIEITLRRIAAGGL